MEARGVVGQLRSVTHPRRLTMRALFLSAVLGLASVGLLGLAPSDAAAQWRGRVPFGYYQSYGGSTLIVPDYFYSGQIWSGFYYDPVTGNSVIGPLRPIQGNP